MTATTPDLAALLTAIDSGDDSALPILADLLEEQGDHDDSILLRQAEPIENPGVPAKRSFCWIIRRAGTAAVLHRGALPRRLFLRLKCHDPKRRSLFGRGVRACVYPTRSDAYLALAEALCS